MKKIKVAIYIRVSTKKQVEEGYSLDAQKERLEKLCETNGYIIYKIYSDEGKSGKDTNRPGFQEMMQDMRDNKFDKIIVMKLDRISRSVIDLEVMIKEMKENNCDFESASEKIDTGSSFGMMFIRLLAIFAQFERERIKERITDAFETMVNECKPITGAQPLGYKIEDGKVVIDEEKKNIVNDIFDTYEKVHSLRKTSIFVNSKYNTTLKVTGIEKMMNRTQYYGSYRGNDYYCPAYMTKERWDKLQSIKKDNKHVRVNLTDNIYLFSGLLIDANCGRKMAGRRSKTGNCSTYYYLCNQSRLHGLCNCSKAVNEKWLESYIIDNLKEHIENHIQNLQVEYKKEKIIDNSKEIAKLKEELRRTTISFNKGRIEEDEYDKEYERLENKIKKLEAKPVQKNVKHLEKLITNNYSEMYNKLTKENKQIFLRSIIDKIEIDPFNYKEGKEYIKVYFT